MALDPGQFGELIGRVLADHDLASASAVNLLLGTAAVESRFGTYLRQRGGGPALGAFQMERPTFDWLRETYENRFPEISRRCFEELEWDLRLAILVARLRYHVVAAPLPDAADVPGLAAYWKNHYNSSKGRGSVAAFVAAYRKFVEAGTR